MDLKELNVKFDTNGEQLLLEVINYTSNGSPKASSIGLLRDVAHLIRTISLFEIQTRWQSSRVIDLYFKYKNDAITGYEFVNGWLDCYYNSGYVLVGDGFRFATNDEVMTIALLVLNVLYVKRDSLTNDLKTRLDALWIDFNPTVDSILLWMRTRAQLIDTNPGLHSCAHQLFSGQSLQEYQSIQQRLTQMVQQKLINEQMKKSEEKDVIIRKQTKELSVLGLKMLKVLQELKELKETNAKQDSEVKWQLSVNTELNETIAKLKHENQVLKQLALQNNSFLKDITSNSDDEASQRTDGSNDVKSESCSDISNAGSVLDNTDECDDNAIQLADKLETNGRNDDTDSTTEADDITDSGNHSDAATDDLLLEIYQTFSPNESNDKNESERKDKVFNWNSWQEFFANDSNNNNNHDLTDSSDITVQNSDTYNISNHSFGTNGNRISALIHNM